MPQSFKGKSFISLLPSDPFTLAAFYYVKKKKRIKKEAEMAKKKKKIWKYKKFVLNQVNHSCRGFSDLWLSFGGCCLFSEGDFRGTARLGFPHCSSQEGWISPAAPAHQGRPKPLPLNGTHTEQSQRLPRHLIPNIQSPMLLATSLGFLATNQERKKRKPQGIYIAKSLLTSPKGTRGKF